MIFTSLKYANIAFTFVELSEIKGRRNTGSVIFFTIIFPLCLVLQDALFDSENSEFGAVVVLENFF